MVRDVDPREIEPPRRLLEPLRRNSRIDILDVLQHEVAAPEVLEVSEVVHEGVGDKVRLPPRGVLATPGRESVEGGGEGVDELGEVGEARIEDLPALLNGVQTPGKQNRD